MDPSYTLQTINVEMFGRESVLKPYKLQLLNSESLSNLNAVRGGGY